MSSGYVKAQVDYLVNVPSLLAEANNSINASQEAFSAFSKALDATGINERAGFKSEYLYHYNNIDGSFNTVKVNVTSTSEGIATVLDDIAAFEATNGYVDSASDIYSSSLSGTFEKSKDTGAAAVSEIDNAETQSFWDWLDETFSSLADGIQAFIATVVDTFTSLILGLVELVEGLVDGIVMLAAAIGSGFVSLVNLIPGVDIGDPEAIQQWAADVVLSTDWVNAIGSWFYNTEFGKWVVSDSLITVIGGDTARGALVNTGKWIGILAISLIPGVGVPLASGIAGVSGMGRSSEQGLMNGESFWSATGRGVVNGVVDAFTAFCGGRVANAFIGPSSGLATMGRGLFTRWYNPAHLATTTEIALWTGATSVGLSLPTVGVGLITRRILQLGVFEYFLGGGERYNFTGPNNPYTSSNSGGNFGGGGFSSGGGAGRGDNPNITNPDDITSDDETPSGGEDTPSGGTSGGENSGGGGGATYIPDSEDDTPSGEMPTPEGEKPSENTEDEEPGTEEPSEDEPTDDSPVDEEPGDDEPNDEEPSEDQPADDTPVDENPGNDEPNDEEPSEDEPVSPPADELQADPNVEFINVGPEWITPDPWIDPNAAASVVTPIVGVGTGASTIVGAAPSGGTSVEHTVPTETPAPEFTFESMTPTVENPALDSGLLDTVPSASVEVNGVNNVTTTGPVDVPVTPMDTTIESIEITPASDILDTTPQTTNSGFGVNTMVGLGGIATGGALAGAYVSSNKKEKEENLRNAASNLQPNNENNNEGFNQL